MVGQVKVVGILMLIHGVLVCLMGAFYSAMGPLMMAIGPGPGGGAGGGPPPALITVIYLAIGIPVLLCGVLQAFAGFRVISFRNRVFAIVTIFLNIVPMMTCYCIPTSIAIMVYGLIVLFNSDVSRAFELVSGGATPEEVVRKLGRQYGDARDDYDDMYGPRRELDDDRRRRRRDDDEFEDDRLQD